MVSACNAACSMSSMVLRVGAARRLAAFLTVAVALLSLISAVPAFGWTHATHSDVRLSVEAPDHAVAGSDFTIKVSVSNQGPETADGTRIRMEFEPGTTGLALECVPPPEATNSDTAAQTTSHENGVAKAEEGDGLETASPEAGVTASCPSGVTVTEGAAVSAAEKPSVTGRIDTLPAGTQVVFTLKGRFPDASRATTVFLAELPDAKVDDDPSSNRVQTETELSSQPAREAVFRSAQEEEGVSTRVSVSNPSPRIGDRVNVDTLIMNSGESADNVEVMLQLSNEFMLKRRMAPWTKWPPASKVGSTTITTAEEYIGRYNPMLVYDQSEFPNACEVEADQVFCKYKVSVLETTDQNLTCVVENGDAVCPTQLLYDATTNTVRATIPRLPKGSSLKISADTELTMAAQYQKPYEVWAEVSSGKGRSSATLSWRDPLTTPVFDLCYLISSYGPVAIFPVPGDLSGPDSGWHIREIMNTFLVRWEVADQDHLIAHLKDGYTFPDGATSHDFGPPQDYWGCWIGGFVQQGMLDWGAFSMPIPAPQVNDPCGPDNAVWIKPEDDYMLIWEITDQGHLIARLNAQNYPIFPDLTTSHDYGVAPDSGVPCVDLPQAPAVNDPCGPDNAVWIKPEDTARLRWEITSDNHLVAHTKDGLVFRDGSSTHDYGLAVDSGEECIDLSRLDVKIPMTGGRAADTIYAAAFLLALLAAAGAVVKRRHDMRVHTYRARH